MAKSKSRSTRRRSSRRRGSMSAPRKHNVPLLPVIGVTTGIGLPLLNGFNLSKGQPTMQRASNMLNNLGQSIYGYDVNSSTFNTAALPQFWAPVAGTGIAHIVLSKLGVNRALGRARLGFTL